jgi:hypothetical protein
MGSSNDKSSKKEIIKPPTPMEIKTYIMVCQTKMTLFRNKKVQLIKKKREEIRAALLQNNLDIAKAKMDSIIREEDLITVYDILTPLFEILKEKVNYMMNSKEPPSDLRAQLDTIVYASFRTEVDDLQKLTNLIRNKYGQNYVELANNNTKGLVNINVVEKLKIKPAADAFLIIRLKQLCKEMKINYEFPNDYGVNPFDNNNNNTFDNNGKMNEQFPTGSQLGNPFQGEEFNPYNNNNNMNNYNNNNNFGGNNFGGNNYNNNNNFGGNNNNFGDGGFGNFDNFNNNMNNNNNNNNGGFGNFDNFNNNMNNNNNNNNNYNDMNNNNYNNNNYNNNNYNDNNNNNYNNNNDNNNFGGFDNFNNQNNNNNQNPYMNPGYNNNNNQFPNYPNPNPNDNNNNENFNPYASQTK